MAYYFLERVLSATETEKSFLIFVDKVLNDSLSWISSANSPFLVEFLNRAVLKGTVEKHILNLKWVNCALDKLSDCSFRLFGEEIVNYELLTSIFLFRATLVKQGTKLITRNEGAPYEGFREEVRAFEELIRLIFNDQTMEHFGKLLEEEELDNNEQFLVLELSSVMFTLFLENFPLEGEILEKVTVLILKVCSLSGEEQSLRLWQFKLIYQLLNRSTFELQHWHYQVILRWLKTQLGQEFLETSVNQACIILQLLYFFMHGNVFAKTRMVEYFSEITLQLHKTFLKFLIDYDDYLQLIQAESNTSRRDIALQNIRCG